MFEACCATRRLREAISSLSECSFRLKKGLLPARPTIKGLSKLGWDSHNKKLAQGGTEEGAFMKLNSAITLPFLCREDRTLVKSKCPRCAPWNRPMLSSNLALMSLSGDPSPDGEIYISYEHSRFKKMMAFLLAAMLLFQISRLPFAFQVPRR